MTRLFFALFCEVTIKWMTGDTCWMIFTNTKKAEMGQLTYSMSNKTVVVYLQFSRKRHLSSRWYGQGFIDFWVGQT